VTAQVTWPGLLEPAIGYALAAAGAVTPELLPRPTPCRGWNVRILLRHICESLTALQEGFDAGRIGLDPGPDDPAGDPAQAFRDRAAAVLAGTHGRPGVIAVADRQVTLAVMAGVGALELAVHGWDLSRACGRRQPIPGILATSLLHISPLLVPRTGRHPLFAAPVPVAATASPGDKLIAYLGRSPGWPQPARAVR
jgi:uncharacterized protein (TIGR03086 family)